MPDSRSDVYIDASLLDTLSAQRDVNNEIRIFEADNIGQYTVLLEFITEIPTVASDNVNIEYSSTASNAYSNNTLISYSTGDSPVSGTNDVYHNIMFNTTSSGYTTCLVDFTIDYIDTGYTDRIVDITVGNKFQIGDSVRAVYRVPYVFSGSNDIWTDYMNFTGTYTIPSGIPLPSFDGYIDIPVTFGYQSTISGEDDVWVDISFAGWVDFPVTFDVYSSLQNQEGLDSDVHLIPGGLYDLDTDVYSSDLSIEYITSDLFSSLENIEYLDFESTTISGGLFNLDLDLISSDLVKLSLKIDVDLYSLKITNFVPRVDEYINLSEPITVDVVDDICPVSVSGTYMMVNDVQVPTTFSGIDDGYRLFYYADSTFNDYYGPREIKVHGENICGDTLDAYYYLTSGYVVEYVNYPGKLDYGPGSEVTVRIKAEDMASCPTENVVAYKFFTDPLSTRDLGASIVGIPLSDEQSDLSASIYPQSSAFFYNKEYEVVLNARDFSGNLMKPLIIRFTIEDKPD